MSEKLFKDGDEVIHKGKKYIYSKNEDGRDTISYYDKKYKWRVNLVFAKDEQGVR
ncbi:hypothetical protein [Paenibacillus terrigena]|uniref:hypothetical protein n=1 Tax=Paenibacillus terrigena TaxID=369333 RepID=UPI00037AF947|nr:hypothetical protein [Paenibacillus terrigena]